MIFLKLIICVVRSPITIITTRTAAKLIATFFKKGINTTDIDSVVTFAFFLNLIFCCCYLWICRINSVNSILWILWDVWISCAKLLTHFKVNGVFIVWVVSAEVVVACQKLFKVINWSEILNRVFITLLACDSTKSKWKCERLFN